MRCLWIVNNCSYEKYSGIHSILNLLRLGFSAWSQKYLGLHKKRNLYLRKSFRKPVIRELQLILTSLTQVWIQSNWTDFNKIMLAYIWNNWDQNPSLILSFPKRKCISERRDNIVEYTEMHTWPCPTFLECPKFPL